MGEGGKGAVSEEPPGARHARGGDEFRGHKGVGGVAVAGCICTTGIKQLGASTRPLHFYQDLQVPCQCLSCGALQKAVSRYNLHGAGGGARCNLHGRPAREKFVAGRGAALVKTSGGERS